MLTMMYFIVSERAVGILFIYSDGSSGALWMIDTKETSYKMNRDKTSKVKMKALRSVMLTFERNKNNYIKIL